MVLATDDRPKTEEIVLKVKIALDPMWVRNNPGDDPVEYLSQRLNSALGFRGQVTGIRQVKR